MNQARLERTGAGRYALAGDLNFDSVAALARSSSAMFEEGAGALAVDLVGVARSDSAGLALLTHWMRRAQAAGQSIVFRNIPAQMLAIAQVSGLDSVLPLER